MSAKIQGWSSSYNLLNPSDSKYLHNLHALNLDMANDVFVLRRHKAYAAFVMRDYLTARILLLKEMLALEENGDSKAILKADLLRRKLINNLCNINNNFLLISD